MTEMIERVGEELRKECLEVFGSTWSYDVAWRFAAAAIRAMREPTEGMIAAAWIIDEATDEEVWRAMLDAALNENEEKV